MPRRARGLRNPLHAAARRPYGRPTQELNPRAVHKLCAGTGILKAIHHAINRSIHPLIAKREVEVPACGLGDRTDFTFNPLPPQRPLQRQLQSPAQLTDANDLFS